MARENLRMHLFSGAKIYFLDEAMFTSKTYRKREFMTSRQSIVASADQLNMEATAFLGVIGWDKKVVHYELHPKSINMVKYFQFLRNLRAKSGRERIVLYMDNLLIHKYTSTLRMYDKLNIVPVFAPISSPELNPIEFLFSKLKALTRKERLKDLVNNRKRSYN